MNLIITRQKRNPNIIVITTLGPSYQRLYKGDDDVEAVRAINAYYDKLYAGIEMCRKKSLERIVKTRQIVKGGQNGNN